MPKFLGRFSNRGLVTFLTSTFLETAKGAGATFLPPVRFLAPAFTPGLAPCNGRKRQGWSVDVLDIEYQCALTFFRTMLTIHGILRGETRWPERKQKSVIQGHTHNRSSHIERLLQLHALLIYGGAHESKAGLDAQWDHIKTARTNVKQGLGKTWPRGEYFDIEFLPKYTSDRDTTWPRITATSSPSRLTTLQAG